MATSTQGPLVLLLGLDPDLRELNELILADAGYRTEEVPAESDPVDFASRTQPDVIVAGVPPLPLDQTVIDLLRANPTTRQIPVCVIATGERSAAASNAAPNVRDCVVAPYDAGALEDAVARALGNPPPSAVLLGVKAASPAVRFASEQLTVRARQIVLRAVRRLHDVEPYRSRFPGLSRALVDDMGTIFGAVATALGQGVSPADLVAVPEIDRAVEDQVRLRRFQGIDLAAILFEYQAMKEETDRFLGNLVGLEGFTSADAFSVSQMITPYVNALERRAAARYVETSGQ